MKGQSITALHLSRMVFHRSVRSFVERPSMFGVIYGADTVSTQGLVAVAHEFSPRIEVCGEREVSLDLTGVTRLFGDARTIAEQIRHDAVERGLEVRIAIAGTQTAARLL